MTCVYIDAMSSTDLGFLVAGELVVVTGNRELDPFLETNYVPVMTSVGPGWVWEGSIGYL